MSWGSIIGGVLGGAGGLASGIVGASGAKKAAKALAVAMAKMGKQLDSATADIEGFSKQYLDTMINIDENYDMYDMEQAFNSLYEGVIMPMERDFDENVLPQIQAAYSGGVMGASAGLSGAAAEAESRARRDLSESKAGLRFQERDKAISRNMTEYNRRMDLAGTQFQVQQIVPMLKMQNAATMYGASQDYIGARLAATQAKAQIPFSMMSGIQSGMSIGSGFGGSLQGMLGGGGGQGGAAGANRMDLAKGYGKMYS